MIALAPQPRNKSSSTPNSSGCCQPSCTTLATPFARLNFLV